MRESRGFVLLAINLECRLSDLIGLAHLMNNPPRRVFSTRYDRDHVPRIAVPTDDCGLVSFALSDRLNLKAEPVTGRPSAGDVEFFRAVAATNYCATSFRAKAARGEPSVGVNHADPFDQAQPHCITEREFRYEHRTNYMNPSLPLRRLLCAQERIWRRINPILGIVPDLWTKQTRRIQRRLLHFIVLADFA